jgi:hypothetical protein
MTLLAGALLSTRSDTSDDSADPQISRRLSWPLRAARGLVDGKAVEFQAENGKSLFHGKLTGEGTWIFELEGPVSAVA